MIQNIKLIFKFLLFTSLWMTVSCSVNTCGYPVECKYYENETCRIKDISAWGFHLRTEPTFSFTIGAVKFRYLTAKPDIAHSGKVSILEAMSHKHSKSWQEKESFDTGAPFVTHLGITGLSLGSDHFLLGMQRASRLLVPQEFKGLLIYNYHEIITQTQAYIKKEKE